MNRISNNQGGMEVNLTNAEIAERLDGMKVVDIDVRKCSDYLLLHQSAGITGEFPMQIGFIPYYLLAFCRAVVERCDKVPAPGTTFTVEECSNWILSDINITAPASVIADNLTDPEDGIAAFTS